MKETVFQAKQMAVQGWKIDWPSITADPATRINWCGINDRDLKDRLVAMGAIAEPLWGGPTLTPSQTAKKEDTMMVFVPADSDVVKDVEQKISGGVTVVSTLQNKRSHYGREVFSPVLQGQKEDHLLSSEELKARYSVHSHNKNRQDNVEHPFYPRETWTKNCMERKSILPYWDWVLLKLKEKMK